jgi:hypothetical protein
MTAPDEVLAVHRAAADTPCRRCGYTIARGARAALLAGVGAVHVRCILPSPAAQRPRDDPEETILTRHDQDPEPRAATDGDVGEDEPWPSAITSQPTSVPVADDDDPRSVDWWQW